MSHPGRARVALATVVTERAIAEFLMLKRSFELFHGPDHHWFIRCDEASLAALMPFPNVHAVVSAAERAAATEPLSRPSWRLLMSEKMNAIEDAWTAGDWDAVAYLDSDLLVTAPFLACTLALGGQVVLSPHYRGSARAAEQPDAAGDYNGGFVLMRDRTFHHWWRGAAASESSFMADQTCLGRARGAFDVKETSPAANVGWWRGASMWEAPAVPADTQFCHVHLFQDAHHDYELSQKAFALNCLEFLESSLLPAHRLLAQEILARDTIGYYDTMLHRRLAVLTMCEPRRAVRLLLMAQTLPRQTEVIGVARGTRAAMSARLNGAPLPSHLHVATEVNDDRRGWLARCDRAVDFVFAVDIDFVFPLGFWYKLLAARQTTSGDGEVVGPVPLQDPDGRFLWYQFWHRYHAAPAATVPLRDGVDPCVRSAVRADILDAETARTHYLPLTAAHAACAAPMCPAEVNSRVPACLATASPGPGMLMPAGDFVANRRADTFHLATNSFMFHLWHPADQESPCAGWY